MKRMAEKIRASIAALRSAATKKSPKRGADSSKLSSMHRETS